MTHKKREIPWNKVVQFHKEIVHRAEETFFTFPLRTLDSERWSPLKDFCPTSLAGPWSIPQKSVVSPPLARLIRGGDIDRLFIGGPCWHTRRRVGKDKWAPHLQPVLYREVRVELDSENGFQIVPEKGNWEISPLVYEFMEQKGIRLEKPLDELLPDLIEMARLKSEVEEKDLTRCLIEELGRVIPELGSELNKIKSPPSSHWMLFAPPATASGYNKYLVRDYEGLEKQLESDPDQIGGLRLLEDPPPAAGIDEKIDILPIVPLNESQHKAVTDALKSTPVTVISGPPGCGKSQVVLSLLLNAWANGTSVLFASNNNKAVDVVRERLERFESEFPIAARAGSKGNIGDTLRRTLNIVAAYAKSSGKDNSRATTDRYKRLSSKKESFRGFLESKIPQRVDEALRSALNAYSRYQEAVEELTGSHELHVRDIQNLGYDIDPYDFTAMVTKPLRNWLEGIEECRQKIEQDSRDRSNLLNRAATSADTRNRAVQRAGLDLNSVTDWNWLVSGPGPELIESWLESYKSLLSQPIEQRLAPIDWQEVFSDWKGEENARNWSQRGRQLVKDVRRTCDELSSKVDEIKDIKNRFDEQFHIIRDANIPDDIQVDLDILSEWVAVYATEYEHSPHERKIDRCTWFGDWRGEEDARNWSQSGRQLVKDIKYTCDELSPKVAEIENVKKRFDEQFHIIRDANIPDDIQVDLDILSEWMAVYATECSLPQGKFDWCPWSQRKKLVRKLRSIEAQILPAYPLSVLRGIGELNETARETLSGIIELTRKWITIRNQWDEKKTMRQEIDDRLGALRSRATELSIDGIPDGTDLSAWLKLAETIENKTVVADDAADAWKKRDKLQSIEAEILPAYPLSVLRGIGEMNETARETLSGIIELTRKWITIRNQWDEKKTIRQEIDDRLGALRSRATELRINNIPDGTDLSAWLKLAEISEDKVDVADDAADAWESKVAAEETRERLREVAIEFQSVTSGVPIKEAWVKGPGHDFAKSVSTLGTNPTPDDVVSAKTLLYGESITALLKAWHEARDCETEFRAHDVAAAEVPSELSRITDWWDENPSPISIPRVDRRTLPDSDDELWKRLRACEERDEKWKSYAEETLPDKEKLRDEELKWAIDHLRGAFETVPVGHDDKIRIGQTVKPMIDRREKDWQTDTLQNLFKSFNPGRVKEEISRIDARLEGLSFDIAKNSWLNRVAGDAEAQEAVGALLNHYTRNSYRIGDSSYEIFARALRAVPIWITTAQSSQSIPMQPEIFDLLVIDEATQCTLTNLLPMIHRAKRIVVIGDPDQLPAIGTIGYEAEKSLAARFGITDTELLELLGHAGNDVYKTAVQCMPFRYADVTSLDEHYRSHPLIIGFANQHVYHKRLRLRKDPDQTNRMPFGAGVYGQQVNGCCERGKYSSWINPPEVDAVCELVKQLKECEGFGAFTIGVVTPFKPHARAISEKLDEMELLTSDVTVGTAHKYQGDERDVMIFSPVVAKGISDGAARWVEKPHNLINVAVTRAREALFVVGDLEFCGRQPGVLGKLVKYVKTVSDLRKTSPYELELFSWMITQGWDPEVHVQIGDIEVDFMLIHRGIKLIIEVDGEVVIKPDGEIMETHIEDSSKDASRDAFLQGRGYKVLHVKTRDIRETSQEVLHNIAEALELEWEDDLID